MNTADSFLDEEIALEHELALERARTSLLGFITHLNPNFVVNWHHRLFCRLLDDTVDGDLRRLLISCPPRHGKSEILSRYFPAYVLGRNPDERFICASYGADLAATFNRDVQRIIDRPEYEQVFPRTRLNQKNVRTIASGGALRNQDFFEVIGAKGYYRCAGVGGALTGLGGTYLVCDDLIRNADQARSPTIMAAQREWYDSVFRTRASKDARIMACMTRWSYQDVFQHVIDKGKESSDADQFTVINLPAIKEDVPSEIDPRAPGEALWPEFFPLKALLPHKVSNPRAFASLYQGQPTPGEGGIFKKEWWRYYRARPVDFDRIIISADLTFGSQKGDFCAWQVWGKIKEAAYLLDLVNARQDFNQQVACLRRLVETWPEYREVIIEDAANGAALVSYIRSQVPRVIAVKVRDSKEARAEAISPLIEAGNVYVPEPGTRPWVQDYTLQMSQFNAGRHDDMVDATSLGLARLFPPRGRSLAMPVSITKRSQYEMPR